MSSTNGISDSMTMIGASSLTKCESWPTGPAAFDCVLNRCSRRCPRLARTASASSTETNASVTARSLLAFAACSASVARILATLRASSRVGPEAAFGGSGSSGRATRIGQSGAWKPASCASGRSSRISISPSTWTANVDAYRPSA